MSGLRSGWEATLQHDIQWVVALERGTFRTDLPNVTTQMWFLGDELLQEGVPVANLTASVLLFAGMWAGVPANHFPDAPLVIIAWPWPEEICVYVWWGG